MLLERALILKVLTCSYSHETLWNATARIGRDYQKNFICFEDYSEKCDDIQRRVKITWKTAKFTVAEGIA